MHWQPPQSFAQSPDRTCLTFENFLHHLFPHSFSLSLYSFLSWPEPAAKVPGKKNLFSLYFWIWAQVCEGFGNDLQTFERIRVEIWGNPPPSLKKQVALARNWAKIGCFNWGFLWDFGFEPEAALWESNFALTNSRFTGANTSQSALMLRAQPSENRSWLKVRAHLNRNERGPRARLGAVQPAGLFQPVAVLQAMKQMLHLQHPGVIYRQLDEMQPYHLFISRLWVRKSARAEQGCSVRAVWMITLIFRIW